MNKSDFNFKFVGHGHYRVTYTSPKTGKEFKAGVHDMPLIDATKNTHSPKKKDLQELKRLVKSSIFFVLVLFTPFMVSAQTADVSIGTEYLAQLSVALDSEFEFIPTDYGRENNSYLFMLKDKPEPYDLFFESMLAVEEYEHRMVTRWKIDDKGDATCTFILEKDVVVVLRFYTDGVVHALLMRI
jgi:hypothetical protein